MPSFDELPESLKSNAKRWLKPIARDTARRVLPLVQRASGNPAPLVGKPTSTAAREKTAKATARAYTTLARALPGDTTSAADAIKSPPPQKEVGNKIKAAKRLRAESAVVDQIVLGKDLASGVISAAAQLLNNGNYTRALSLGHSLRADAATRELGETVIAIALLHTSTHAQAWKVFSRLADPHAHPAAAEFYFSAAIAALGDSALPLLQEAIAKDLPHSWTDHAVLRVAQYALTAGFNDEAGQLIAHGLSRDLRHSAPKVESELRRLREWLPGGNRLAVAIPPGTSRAFGVMSYLQPGYQSRNVGDYIQTLASLGHLARHTNLSIDAEPELVDVVKDLQNSIKPDRSRPETKGSLRLFDLYRDGNVYQDIPEDSWTVFFGWLMHDTFGRQFNIPFHPNLRPILVSVYIRYPEMLTADAIEYLSKYSPVGCRDWQTVALLQAVGVPAFFSGCITTTVDTLFPESHKSERTGTICVDWPDAAKGENKEQAITAIRDQSLPRNLELAREWVAEYSYAYEKVQTSRLHAYLPARSVGAEVDFVPKNKSDWRFGGLIDINDEAYEKIRHGILDKLEVMIPMIASGRPSEQIYSEWRRLTEPEVKNAEQRIRSASLPRLDLSTIKNLAESFTITPAEGGDANEIYIDHRGSTSHLLANLVRSIEAHAESDYRIWLLRKGLSSELLDRLESGLVRGSIGIIDVSPDSAAQSFDGANLHDLTLCLLPHILSHASSVAVIPGASEVRDDITALATSPIAPGQYLAAKDDHRPTHRSGLSVIRDFARRFRDDHESSLQFVFATHRDKTGDFAPFRTTVMRMDLETMRTDLAASQLLGVMQWAGLTASDALQTVVAERRTPLPGEWNVEPRTEFSESVALVNWSDSNKPGSKDVVPYSTT